IQVNYLGFPGTMGASFIDYIIADRIVVPAELRNGYSEAVVQLPDTFQVNDRRRVGSGGPPSRRDAGLPQRAFAFCAFNGNHKVTARVFDVWMNIVRRVQKSVLWIFAHDEAAARNLRREAEARGIAGDRLVLAPRVAYSDYLARYAAADLFLDTFPFNGGTT